MTSTNQKHYRCGKHRQNSLKLKLKYHTKIRVRLRKKRIFFLNKKGHKIRDGFNIIFFRNPVSKCYIWDFKITFAISFFEKNFYSYERAC